MRVLIATTQTPFVRGGAEILAEGLRSAVAAAGHAVDIVSLPFKWYPPERIPEHMLSVRLLDLSCFNANPIDRVIGLKFPAYLVDHPDKSLWLLHQHREAYDLWDRGEGALRTQPAGRAVRDLVRHADAQAIAAIERRYTISRNVSERLRRYCNIDSTPLYHPPLNHDRLGLVGDDGFLFFPSRISSIKRQELAIRALARTRSRIELVIAGGADTPQHQDDLAALAGRLGVSGRIRWLGPIDEDTKIDLYGRCRAVVYVPWDEDYGYVTLEAMLSSKPVVACSDSGGVLEFVDADTGFVCEPEAVALAQAFDAVAADAAAAARAGRNGRARYEAMNIGWEPVVEALLA